MKITKEEIQKLVKESVEEAINEFMAGKPEDDLERRQQAGVKAGPGHDWQAPDQGQAIDNDKRHAAPAATNAQGQAVQAKRHTDQDDAEEDERRAAQKAKYHRERDKGVAGKARKAGRAVASGVKKMFGREEIERAVKEEVRRTLKEGY